MIAIDMKMPESCFGCPFEGLKEGWTVCQLNENVNMNQHDRPDGCPLLEVRTAKSTKKVPRSVMPPGADIGSLMNEISRDFVEFLKKEGMIDVETTEVEVIERFYADEKPNESVIGKLVQLTGTVMVVVPKGGQKDG